MSSKRTVNSENIRSTARAFQKASDEFNAAVANLKSIINTYMSENVNEASDSVQREWQDAQKNLEKVRLYFQEFGKGLDMQAKALDDAFNQLRWKS
jgi:uncharacterized protein YukE